MATRKRSRSNPQRRLLVIVGTLVVLGIAGVAAVLLYLQMTAPAETPRRVVHEISLLTPPPPPPPPPPEQPPPPQPPQRIDAPEPEPAPTPAAEAAPPAADLGIDAAGTGAGNGFGLVGRPGGRDLLEAPTIGGGGNPYARFGALVQERVREAVLAHERLRSAPDYQRVVLVWIGSGGDISRFELVGAGQRPELDEALRQALANATPVREALPPTLPQPIRLRITTRS